MEPTTPTQSAAAAEAGSPTLVGISFADRFRAQEFFTAMMRLASKHELALKDAVFVSCDDQGRTRVQETMDPSPGRSAASGAVWASLFGLLLGGPVGWIAGGAIGAGAGAITAKVVDHGIPDEWVGWFKQAVHPGSTILAVLVEDVYRDALVNEIKRFPGSELVYTNFDPLTMQRIEEALGRSGDASPLPPPVAGDVLG